MLFHANLFVKFSFAGIFWCYGHHRWGVKPSKGSICKFGSPSGHITFDPPHWKVIFKSVHHPMLWGVYPEVLVALAQKSWENSISLNRLGEKSQKPCFKTSEKQKQFMFLAPPHVRQISAFVRKILWQWNRMKYLKKYCGNKTKLCLWLFSLIQFMSQGLWNWYRMKLLLLLWYLL